MICSGHEPSNFLSTGLPPRKVAALGDRTYRVSSNFTYCLRKKQDRSKSYSKLSALRGFQHVLFCRWLVHTFKDQHHIVSYSVQLVSFCDSFLSGARLGGSVPAVGAYRRSCGSWDTSMRQPLPSGSSVGPVAVSWCSVLRSEVGWVYKA